MKHKVLNVGGNSKAIPIPPIYKDWDHLLLDIDPAAKPDILCDARELLSLEPAQFDAVYCSHNLEHYYKHEVACVLNGFRHILKPDGFIDIRVPDMETVMRHVVETGLDIDDVLYQSSAGPILVHDVFYGYGKQMERSGNEYFAHKMGFSPASLQKTIESCGFSPIYMRQRHLEIHVIAFLSDPDEAMLSALQSDHYARVHGDGAAPANKTAGRPAQVSTDFSPAEDALIRKGEKLQNQGKLDEAVACYEGVKDVGTDTRGLVYHLNYARALAGLNRLEDALAHFNSAVAIQSDSFYALNGIAELLVKMGRKDEAVTAFKKAVSADDSFPEAFNKLALLLSGLGKNEESLKVFEEALSIEPDNAMTLSNRGTVLAHTGNKRAALASFNAALAVDGGFSAALIGKASMLAHFFKLEEALACYDQALKTGRHRTAALTGKAQVLERLGRNVEALEIFRQLPDSQPDLEIKGAIYRNMQMTASWDGREEFTRKLIHEIEAGEFSVQPFSLLTITDNCRSQLAAARLSAQRKMGGVRDLPDTISSPRDSQGRITVAYMSGDFRPHPITFLMAGVFAHHDASRFNIIGISFYPVGEGEEMARIKQGCSNIYNISKLSDHEAALFIRTLGVDILVDLTGYTLGPRTAILAHKPAPIQINYLGYPGTMGASFIDYIIADYYLIPAGAEQGYSEKIIRLPECFQANDDQRRIAPGKADRSKLGLPEDQFVFCSFSHPGKITPEIFGIWMELLNRVPDSVLWIYCVDGTAIENLCRFAGERGIDASRLIFCQVEKYPLHLRRMSAADLMLDTFPFNGGTTASDALWAGLPIITCSGEAFASRMAGSLLTALELPELITGSLEAYRDKALELAQNPTLLKNIRKKLRQNRGTHPLFDTKRFCTNIENAYLRAWQRHESGSPPVDIKL